MDGLDMAWVLARIWDEVNYHAHSIRLSVDKAERGKNIRMTGSGLQ